jgi:DNA/RNA endonuclease YhcR with UshA esterase domain
MRRGLRLGALVLAAALALTAAPALAQTVAPADARAHVGQTVTVEGTVDQVHTARRSGVTFLDLGGRYPNQAFTGVIFKDDAGKFPEVHALEGKTVDITGKVRLYKGRPEIILRDAGQLKAK